MGVLRGCKGFGFRGGPNEGTEGTQHKTEETKENARDTRILY